MPFIIALLLLAVSTTVNNAQDLLISLPISVRRPGTAEIEPTTFKINHRENLVAKVESFCRSNSIVEFAAYNSIFSFVLDSIRQSYPKLIDMEVRGSFSPPYIQPRQTLNFAFAPYGSFRCTLISSI
jgi:hypothetical protein